MASFVVFKGVPLAGLVKELPAAPSVAAANGAPLAGLVKELPAAPSVAFKGVPLAGLQDLPVAPSVSVPGNSDFSARRLLNTKGHYDDYESTTTEEPSGADYSRRALSFSVPKLFSGDALDVFREPMKLTQLLSLMENGGAASRTGYSGHGWWVSKEDDDALQLKVVMPGLGKEHVKVSAEKNILVVKGEGDKNPEDGDDKGLAKYSRRFQLPAEAFKMDQIKAEMNNGVLKVTIPKIKDEERKDVFQIKVE
ncbi:hypothetical protein SEVIR_4G078800v4 [Setaria viridis]|uniref:SHSP domain-containing protein n=1 Tax=Setaria viridis TaxID=4556 RepID=A0A4U6V8Z6_SETVI|nr:26.2 kDa heat shock protein, mitochondrial-like [Setaria viridis]TKW20317.1 hypothetical protein SEVIR_4G078800v2 [Setaria viridis]